MSFHEFYQNNCAQILADHLLLIHPASVALRVAAAAHAVWAPFRTASHSTNTAALVAQELERNLVDGPAHAVNAVEDDLKLGILEAFPFKMVQKAHLASLILKRAEFCANGGEWANLVGESAGTVDEVQVRHEATRARQSVNGRLLTTDKFTRTSTAARILKN